METESGEQKFPNNAQKEAHGNITLNVSDKF